MRVLNQEETLNFRNKIKFNKKESNNAKEKQKEIIKIITEIREKGAIELLIIFYFIYFLGLNYSTVERMALKNFKKEFNYLILKKRKKENVPILM